MLYRSALRASRAFTPRLALSHSRLVSSLVFLEHKAGKLSEASLSAVTAAKTLGNDVSLCRDEFMLTMLFTDARPSCRH